MGNFHHCTVTILAMGLTTVAFQPLSVAGQLPAASRPPVHHENGLTTPGLTPMAAPGESQKQPSSPAPQTTSTPPRINPRKPLLNTLVPIPIPWFYLPNLKR